MDFQSLISCIQCYEKKNTDVIVETMKTIVSLCSEEEFGKDAFRDVGGLDFLMEYITNTDQVIILEYGLKVLAFLVDGNVHNQKYLTNERTFILLQVIFEREGYPISIVKNAAVLFSTILYQNKCAQDLLHADTYLQTLMIQYKHYAPTYTSHNQQIDPHYLDVWLNISSILCFAVNNPLNAENQGICSVLLPLSLKIIETSTSLLITEASSSFLSLCIANNEKNQDIFAENEGLLILKCLLNKNLKRLKTYMRKCNNTSSKATLDAVSSLISIISAAVFDHEENAALCGKLGIVSQMIDLLSIEILNNSSKKKLILALGYSIEAYGDNRFIVLDVPYFDSLLKSNLKEADVELHSAAKYLLQVCLRKHGNELFMKSAEHGEGTEFSNHSLFLKPFNKRSIDAQSEHADTQEMLPQLQQRNCKKHIYHEKGSYEHLRTLSQHHNDRIPYRKHELSCLSNKFLIQRTETAKRFETNTSNLLLLNSKTVNYQDKENKYADRNSMEEDESSESDSLSRICLQNADHLFRLNTEEMKMSPKNEVKIKSEDTFKFSNNGDFCTSGVNDDSEAFEDLVNNSLNKKKDKRKMKENLLDRRSHPDKLVSSGLDIFYQPYPLSQGKNISKSGNPNAGKCEMTQNRMPGCMEVIVLSGTRCSEHKLAAHFEMLKLCSLSE